MNDQWDSLIINFRKLGGHIKNIQQKKGKRGRGIFAIDPRKESQLFIPSCLIIETDNIFFSRNKLFLKKNKSYKKEIIDFIEFYLNEFSFNNETKSRLINFEKELNSFNAITKLILKKYLFFDIEKRSERKLDMILLDSYKATRAFKFNNKRVICPFLELYNHESSSSAYLIKKTGIKYFSYPTMQDELTINYGNQSSLKRFLQFQFLSKENTVFSLPFSIEIEDSENIFICYGNDINSNDLNLIKKNHKKLSIDSLPIAFINNKNLTFKYFQKIFRNVENINFSKKHLFKKIINFNIFIRQKIKEDINSIDNPSSKMLKEVLEYEINLINSNFIK